MKYALFLLVAMLAGAFALVTSPTGPCPNNQPYTLTSNNLPAEQTFLENALHYNRYNLKSGTPIGPYFSIDTSKASTFVPNGAFDAYFNLFNDSSRSLKIGSAHFHSDSLSVSNNIVSGYIQVTTDITTQLYPASDASRSNYRSQSTQTYYRGDQCEASDPANPSRCIANRLETIGGQLYMSLWGSSGWSGNSWDASQQGTGVDMRLRLSCPSTPPPIIVGCPCDDNLQTQSYSAYTEGSTVRVTGSSCVALAWA